MLQNLISTFLIGLSVIGGALFPPPTIINQPIVENPTPPPVEQELGAVLPVGAATYTLAGSGVSGSASSVTLTSLTIPQTGYELEDSDFSPTFYATLEPGSRDRQEFISCTTVTQSSSDNTATLSGCSRGLLPFSPYSASTTYAFSHAGGSKLIFSDSPQLFEEFTAAANDETITGTWSTQWPTGSTSIASKGYVDAVVTGGTLNYDQTVVAGVAGETIATGTILYFDTIQNEWMLADASDVASSTQAILGIAQGDGTNGNTISGGVLLAGRDTNNVGGTAGDIVYISNTAGATSTTPGTVSRAIGAYHSSSALYFDPHFEKVTAFELQQGTLLYGEDTGASDAYAITLTPALTSYASGTSLFFSANTANTATSTLNVNGLGAKDIVHRNGTHLNTGDVIADQVLHVVYDGVNFVLLSPRGLYDRSSTDITYSAIEWSSKSLASTTITGGDLGTNNMLRGKLFFEEMGGGGLTFNTTFRMSYGGSYVASTSVYTTESSGGVIDFELMGSGTTGTQEGGIAIRTHKNAQLISASSTQDMAYDAGTVSVDSTTDQVLNIEVAFSDGDSNADITMTRWWLELVE